jgi:hypothetical protein
MTKTTVTEEIYLVRRHTVVVETVEADAPASSPPPSLRPPAKALARRIPQLPGFYLLAGGAK